MSAEYLHAGLDAPFGLGYQQRRLVNIRVHFVNFVQLDFLGVGAADALG